MSGAATRAAASGGRSTRFSLPGAWLLLLSSTTTWAAVFDADDLLRRADERKTSHHGEFVALLDTLGSHSTELTAEQQDYLRFLRGWQIAYRGGYEAGLAELRAVAEHAGASDLGFRARATIVNLLSIARRYDEVFQELNHVIDRLPEVSGASAREQGIGVIALLYNQVGQYELGLSHAQSLLRGEVSDRAACIGRQLQIEALYRTGRLQSSSPELIAGIGSCTQAGEVLYANAIRTFLARTYRAEGQIGGAIALLESHYEEALQTQYARLISEYDSLLAEAYWRRGDTEFARRFALNTIQSAVRDHYTEPLITAYRILHELARAEGDMQAALMYHEKYAAADKGYLDDVSARQLAYERVRHQTAAARLQVETLDQQNQLLRLERENARLYIVLLLLVLGFIGFWAYRTKRSQLHFMRLARVDSLTGIANRPHFLEQAGRALENSRRLGQEVSVALCDLDFFKLINDRYGHATGDFVLKQVVEACRLHLRADDVFGRFGGEEFGIVLPGCSLETARERCERLRVAIAAIAIHPGSMVAQVSASFGVAATSQAGYELRQLLAHADAALYRAKHAGRNRIELHSAAGAAASTACDEPLRGLG